MYWSSPHAKSAFTLVELAIVLVIIGLIIGGILFGQDLIRAAVVRTQIGQIREYEMAHNTFKVKYNCMPGDCATATEFFSDVDDGNGDEAIKASNGTSYDNPLTWTSEDEPRQVFQHLQKSGFVKDHFDVSSQLVGQGLPAMSINPKAGFFILHGEGSSAIRNPDYFELYSQGKTRMAMVACNVTANNNMYLWDDFCGIFLASDLKNIDEKIDDGAALTGGLLSFGGGVTNNNCLNGSEQYDLSYKTPQCQASYILE